jgi:hypothetical protein
MSEPRTEAGPASPRHRSGCEPRARLDGTPMMQRLRVRLFQAASVENPARRIALALHDFEMGEGGCRARGRARESHIDAYMPRAYQILLEHNVPKPPIPDQP